MKFFTTIDEKFSKIGFIKIEENEYAVTYTRGNDKYGYCQELELLHKKNGRHIVQSCDKDLMDSKRIGNTCVGLTMYEMKLCIKKMKQMGWKEVK